MEATAITITLGVNDTCAFIHVTLITKERNVFEPCEVPP